MANNARLGLYAFMAGAIVLVADTLAYTREYVRPLIESAGFDAASIAALGVVAGLYMIYKRRIG